MSSHQWLKSQKSNTILPEQKFEKFFRILISFVNIDNRTAVLLQPFMLKKPVIFILKPATASIFLYGLACGVLLTLNLMLLVQRLPNKIGFVSNAKLLDVLAPLMATWLSITP